MQNDRMQPIIVRYMIKLLCYTQAVLDKRQAMAVEGAEPKRKLAKDLENELGEDYYMDMRQHWDLKQDDEKHDVIPEIYLGKNVADFIDPDIMRVGHLVEVFSKVEVTKWACSVRIGEIIIKNKSKRYK